MWTQAKMLEGSPIGRQALDSVALGHFFALGVCFLNYTINDDLQMGSRVRILFFFLPLSFLFSEPVARSQGNGKRWGGLGGQLHLPLQICSLL